MNQAIQFPDREEWDTAASAIIFPALVNGMQLTCAIKKMYWRIALVEKQRSNGWPFFVSIAGTWKKRLKH
ncbi:hypothetical protein SEEH1831_03645 [Salmonella enterica subsp. enterica serovar Heidelberg str. 77-1831]|nr:hypothetical protein SEEH1565_15516 [Salmonella enterica subsp. enterica serovar Heidelberg str. 41565]EYH85659.1 hypothetical protein SEEHN189_06331 [Salmonella enterica subsp. enterica serovar Heidelberg str. N189]KJT36641.1 hypothetical protein SEEH3374_12696 [Salmonella enterica subsp. enterica serovar Heidelberg str. RI-11-013374]KJT58027.1 hypothetical protein SEEH3712_21177 [Salmonella enterica subsp. enterica serovar Heidelberg str. 622737-12]KJT59764.1 hypothetical protein SEEH3343_